MVKVSFQDPGREDLVFVAGAAKTRAFSFKGCYNKEFIAVTGQLLKEKARFQSEPQSKQSEKKEAVRKRQKAEEPDRNPWIKTLGCLGHVLGIVLLFHRCCFWAGSFSRPGDDHDACRVVDLEPLGEKTEGRFSLARSQWELRRTQ